MGDELARAISRPIPDVRTVPGQVVSDGAGGLAVNVNGATPAATWPATYIPQVGDAVRVIVLDGRALVLGPITSEPRPATGTIDDVPVDGLVPVSTSLGIVQARYVGSDPTPGDLVRLDWQSTQPWVWPGVVAPVPEELDYTQPDAPAAPPAVPSSGTLTLTALDSGTWNAAYSAWSSFHGTNVVQGTWSSQAYRGAWFYGSQAQAIAGKTITAARIRLGARLRIGSYNSGLSLQVYHHASGTRPSGDVARDSGPVSIALGVNEPAGWFLLDTTLAALLVSAGGGIGIAGGSYGGVAGIGTDPASGQIQLDWTD